MAPIINKSFHAKHDISQTAKFKVTIVYILSHQLICLSDLFRIYNHTLLAPEGTPHTFQNKVQMDLHYYLVRRRSENIYKWTKSTFKVITNDET